MYNEDNDFSIIEGVIVSGKFVYTYPQWMFTMQFGTPLDTKDKKASPKQKPITETYEIFNPKNIELVEDAKYKGRIISFDDGNIVEILSPLKDDNEGKNI